MTAEYGKEVPPVTFGARERAALPPDVRAGHRGGAPLPCGPRPPSAGEIGDASFTPSETRIEKEFDMNDTLRKHFWQAKETSGEGKSSTAVVPSTARRFLV